METNDSTNPTTGTPPRRRWRGEPATEAGEDAAAAPPHAPDAAESAPKADAPAAAESKPELTERQAWKRRRAIALGVIKP